MQRFRPHRVSGKSQHRDFIELVVSVFCFPLLALLRSFLQLIRFSDFVATCKNNISILLNHPSTLLSQSQEGLVNTHQSLIRALAHRSNTPWIPRPVGSWLSSSLRGVEQSAEPTPNAREQTSTPQAKCQKTALLEQVWRRKHDKRSHGLLPGPGCPQSSSHVTILSARSVRLEHGTLVWHHEQHSCGPRALEVSKKMDPPSGSIIHTRRVFQSRIGGSVFWDPSRALG